MTLPAINAIAAGLWCGVLTWASLWLARRAAGLLRWRGAFPELVLNAPAEHSWRELRRRQADLLLLGAAAGAALAGAAAALVFGAQRFASWTLWLLFGLGCGGFLVWGFFLVRTGLRWYEVRFAARADAALGAVFMRLALQGHRVFHGVPLGEELLGHVVIGTRGAFVVELVARRPRKAAHSARLHGRLVEFQDGIVWSGPVVSAERGARVLADLSVRNLSHRINVKPVVALPGWEIAPAEAPVSDVLLINEKNAMMLLGWSKPADQLFDEDVAKLQDLLARLCANPYG